MSETTPPVAVRKPVSRRAAAGDASSPAAPVDSPDNCTFHFGVHSDRNFPSRRTMEDAHSYEYNFNGVDDQGLFAIFDGHGGKTAARWCSQRIPQSFGSHLRENPDSDVQELLRDCFLVVDSQLTPENGIHSGCTAVLSFLCTQQEKRVLYTANVGDARAVLYRAGRAVRLSYDHKGSDSLEQKRIKDAGGFITNERVNGLLAVTRSLGDHEMKEYVIGEPYTTRVELGPEDSILVLACDGVWDVMSDQQACELADKHTDPTVAAKEITDTAIQLGSYDNISVIVVYLAKRKTS